MTDNLKTRIGERELQALVEALKEIAKEEHFIRPAVPAWGIAVTALRNLPEDLR